MHRVVQLCVRKDKHRGGLFGTGYCIIGLARRSVDMVV